MGFDILSSLLVGSALGRVLGKLLAYNLGLNLFTAQEIPGFSPELAISKSFDILDFVLTLGITLVSYLFFRYFLKLKSSHLKILSLVFAFVIFLQVNFGFYSNALILGLVAIYYTALLVASKLNIKLTKIDASSSSFWVTLTNGLLLGFYLLLLINTQTTTLFPLLALVITPIIYIFVNRINKISGSVGHVSFALAIFAPNNLPALVAIGVVSVFLVLFLRHRKLTSRIRSLYPIVFIAALSYNPLYYLGHLDSVEEGFWLGWLAGINDGKTLYKDIAAYHPPVIIWILAAFEKLAGMSIANTRLVLHLLQIVGLVFYYVLVSKILDKKLSRVVVMLLALSLTAIMVRNNVEFRLGVGLLGIALIPFPLAAGAIAALSLLTSVEVGVATLIAALLTLGFAGRRVANMSKYLLGFGAVAIPVALYLLVRGALGPAIAQIGFYAKAFSEGYFNLPIDRPVASAFIHWHFVNQYVSSYQFYWELARGAILATLIIAFTKLRNLKLDSKAKIAFALSIFGLLIFRSAMGRSDYYHLLFPLLVALPLAFYALETFNKKYLVPVFSFLLVFVFFRNIVHASFIETKLYSLQTFGKAIGEQEEVLTVDQLQLVDYIKNNTKADQSLFVFPWNPEIYYLSDRPNATSHYVPYGFFASNFQNQMIEELRNAMPVIVYNPEMKFANLGPGSLELVNRYILENYAETTSFGNYKIWRPKD